MRVRYTHRQCSDCGARKFVDIHHEQTGANMAAAKDAGLLPANVDSEQGACAICAGNVNTFSSDRQIVSRVLTWIVTETSVPSSSDLRRMAASGGQRFLGSGVGPAGNRHRQEGRPSVLRAASERRDELRASVTYEVSMQSL